MHSRNRNACRITQNTYLSTVAWKSDGSIFFFIQFAFLVYQLSFNLLSLFTFGKQGEQYIHTYSYQYIQTCLCAQASIAFPLYDSHAAPSLFPSSQIYEQLRSDYYCTLPQLPSPNTFCHQTVFCNRTLICS